ncbi:VOC family protein [Muricauda sp. MAR_2010_75]|uniref:VOC family protein n=1 Tax=Allomuricauda sp. MAR_2010_75 TaxID=1250232 RepID=UPI000565CE12|nr:VOC family protein [Muricauda sp. MAR_2010_75]
MKTIKKQQKITPFLWFDDQAEKAINFYVSLFPNSKINSMKRWPKGGPFPSNTIQTGSFDLNGVTFHAFDAGPQFQLNPSISFFALFETKEEVDTIWEGLSDGGRVLMPLDSYPWSEHYGWVTDRFGVSWQIMQGNPNDVNHSVVPLLMFSGDQQGNAEKAIEQYISIFLDSSLEGISRYEATEPGPEGMVKHAQFTLAGQTFMTMDNGTDTDVPFNEAISLFVNCKDQKEVDHLWNELIKDGGSESQCGWLKDKYGVSWQIVPEFLLEKVAHGDPSRVQNMMAALYTMQKLDVQQLEEAYNK